MKIVLVSKCSLDIEQYVEFKMSVLISPSKSLISSRWVTNMNNLYVLHCMCRLASRRTFQIPPDRLCGSHMMTYLCGYCS